MLVRNSYCATSVDFLESIHRLNHLFLGSSTVSISTKTLATKMIVAAVAIAGIATAARILATPAVGEAAYSQGRALAPTAMAQSLHRNYAGR